jgi:trimeric autotransporter adhesin
VNPSGTNDLVITIGGDLSDLQAAFDQIPQLAQEAFGSVESAIQSVDWDPITEGASQAAQSIDTINTSANGATEDLGNLSEAVAAASTDLGDIGDSAEGAEAGISSLGQSVENAGDAASGATETFGTLVPEVEQAGEAAEEAEQGFSSLYGQMLEFGEALAITEGLAEFGEEALTVYGNTEKASISLQALTGSATQANEIIETLKQTATSDALSFPQLTAAAQKMTALGFSTEQMNTVLQSAADTAAATGNEFTAVANSIDRMVLSGTAGARQLATLGLSAQQLNTAMGSAGAGVNASAAAITKAFTALDQAGRLDAITTALDKFDDVATQVAQGVTGQWTNFKTQFEFVMEGVGEALAPVITAMLQFASSTIIPALQSMVAWFNELPGPIKDAAVAAGLLVASLGPVAVAVGGFALAMSGIKIALGEAITEEGVFATITAGIGETLAGAVTAIESVALAVSAGMVGALTAGETALLAFAAAAAAVGVAFVAWDQIKQLIDNVTNLNAVLSAGVPAWNDLKNAASGVASEIAGDVTSAFTSLLGYLGPVGDALKSIGAYLPSFSSLWEDVSAAIGSIHWSDLIGPIGALNGALKALADAIQLVTGNYPAMATAGTAALTTVQTANDKLNASMATQATAVTAAATAVTAHAAASTAATPAVQAHAQAVSQTATAAQAATQSFLALQPTLVQLGITSGTVVNGVEILGSSMRAAQTEAANLGIQLIQVQGAASSTGMAANTAGQAFRNATSGLVSWSNSLQDWIYPYKAASYGIDDLTEGTAAYTAAVEKAASGATGFSSSLTPAMVSAASSAGAAVDGLTGKVGKLGQQLQSVQNMVTGFDANLKAFASSVDSLGSELDAAFGDTGQKIGGLEESLTPGEQITEPFQGTYTDTGTLGSQDPTTAINSIETLGETFTYDAAAVTAAQQATIAQTTASASNTTATAANTTATSANTTATDSSTTAVTVSTDAVNQFGTAMSPIPGVTESVYEALQEASGAIVSVNGNISDLGLSTSQLNAINEASSPVSEALSAANENATSSVGALSDAASSAASAMSSIPDVVSSVSSTTQGGQPESYYQALQGLSGSQGVSGTISAFEEQGQPIPTISPVSGTATPTFGSGTNAGVGGGNTGIDSISAAVPANVTGVTINVNAGTVVGANGMQQLSMMVGNQVVQTLASRGIRLNRQ